MPLTVQSDRRIRDAVNTANIAAPNANATTFSAFIDLGQVTAFPINEVVSLVANFPALTGLVSTKVITLTVEDADANANANAAALATVGQQVITGIAGNTAAAVELPFKLPGACRRYVRIKAVGGADSGTTQAIIGTAELRT